VPKAFEFAESFSKPARLLLAGGLSKVVGAVMPAFQKRIVHQQPKCQISKPVRLPLAGFQRDRITRYGIILF
jgi:hypothetical protein